MLRVRSDTSYWFLSHSIEFVKPIRTGISLDLSRGRDSWCWPKGARPLGTRMAESTKRILYACSINPTRPEAAILGADQKERGLWGRECSVWVLSFYKTQPPVGYQRKNGTFSDQTEPTKRNAPYQFLFFVFM